MLMLPAIVLNGGMVMSAFAISSARVLKSEELAFGEAIAQNHHIEAGGRRSAVDEGVLRL